MWIGHNYLFNVNGLFLSLDLIILKSRFIFNVCLNILKTTIWHVDIDINMGNFFLSAKLQTTGWRPTTLLEKG